MKKKNTITVKKIKNLRDLMKEDIANLIATQGPQDEQAPTTDISLDEKVDHFLVQYERESVPLAQQYTQESKITLKSLMKNLFEAEGDEEPPADEDPNAPPGGDIGGGAPLDLGGPIGGGGGGGSSDLGGDSSGGGDVQKAPPPPPTPKININAFAKDVARLINDYQSLIDPKRVILNRARAFIEKNYNPEVAKQLTNILDTEFNLSVDSLSGNAGGRDEDSSMHFAAGGLEPIGGG